MFFFAVIFIIFACNAITQHSLEKKLGNWETRTRYKWCAIYSRKKMFNLFHAITSDFLCDSVLFIICYAISCISSVFWVPFHLKFTSAEFSKRFCFVFLCCLVWSLSLDLFEIFWIHHEKKESNHCGRFSCYQAYKATLSKDQHTGAFVHT